MAALGRNGPVTDEQMKDLTPQPLCITLRLIGPARKAAQAG